MIDHLYTPADVKKVRDELVKKQKGIDPILKEPFKEVAVLDHSHVTQKVRAALNRNTNAFEGKVQNAFIRCLKWLTDKPLPEILRNLADYYEDTERVEHSMPYHPAFLKRLQTDFNSLPEGSKKAILVSLGQPEGGNSLQRKKSFKKALMTRKFTFEEVSKLIKQEKGRLNEVHGE